MPRLFLFKAFQRFLLTYPHTVLLETLIDNVKLNFSYLSVLWNCYAYTYSFFDNISHTFGEKTAIYSLVCLLRSFPVHILWISFATTRLLFSCSFAFLFTFVLSLITEKLITTSVFFLGLVVRGEYQPCSSYKLPSAHGSLTGGSRRDAK